MTIDGILALGFGGPTPGCCGRRGDACNYQENCGHEARCFVSGILGDNPARQGRVESVAQHYLHFGGFSPYNELTEKQALALQNELISRGHGIPVVCGYRHWKPYGPEALETLVEKGCRNIALLIMAPHQSTVSWDWYIKYAAESAEELGERAPQLSAVVDPWWNHPGFIEAGADRILDAAPDLDDNDALVFTAHAIPQPVETTSPYRRQFEETARLIAERLGHPEHRIAFQSAPDDSRVPWSSPDILDVLDELKAAGRKRVIIQAAGFLVDHTEVMFDLDVEAKEKADELGIEMVRVPCVHDHPAFIRTLADKVEEQVAQPSS